MVRLVQRQVVTPAAVSQTNRHRLAAQQPAQPARLTLGVQPCLQLHGVDHRELQTLTELLTQRLVEKAALDSAVVHHHHLAGHGGQQLVENLPQARRVADVGVGDVVKGH